MLELRKIGVLLRDAPEEYPLEEMSQVLGGHGVELAVLSWPDPPPADLDLIMAMGGDGTVLKALDLYPCCPVLAVNYGTVGFLTAADRTDLQRIIALLVAGRYLVSERLVLDCRHPGGAARAVNEVIVRTANRLIHTDVFVNDTKIRTIRGDGVVVGTPTGSTGFLLSAGAPIVMPDVRCMILDGVNEYNFTSRTLVLTPESRIRLHISPETREPNIFLTVDGQQLGQVHPGDEICVARSETAAKLIYFEPNYFFHNLSSRLSW
ncbi:MAG: NAD(+)/NADH kinase [Gemmatimonadota bacterium]